MNQAQQPNLRALALAASPGGEHIYTNARDSNNWQSNTEWHEAASPAAVTVLFAHIAELEAQQDTNAPWLTQAHILCTDMGIEPGNVKTRIEALRVMLAAVGAGGVEPLRKLQFSHYEARPREGGYSGGPMRAVAVDTLGREMPGYEPSVVKRECLQQSAEPEPEGDAAPAWDSIHLDFKQATAVLEMFGGEAGEVALMHGPIGHSGPGLYAVWTADPEGSVYLGETDEEAEPDAPASPALQAAPPANAAVAVPDDFRGDTATLVRNIIALLELDAEGALVPHGVGGHARGLLSAAAARLAAAPAQEHATSELEKWIDDPHDIEQGRMLNPEWLRAQEHATQLASQGLIDAARGLSALRAEYAQKTHNAMPGNEYWGARFAAKHQALDEALAAAPAQAQEDSTLANVVQQVFDALQDKIDARGPVAKGNLQHYVNLLREAFEAAPDTQDQDCTRSHPHEEMTPMCVLRTEIARLNHAAAIAQAQAAVRDPVRQAIRDYHYALDTPQHGGVAAGEAIDAIQETLGARWVQGQELAARAAQGGDKP